MNRGLDPDGEWLLAKAEELLGQKDLEMENQSDLVLQVLRLLLHQHSIRTEIRTMIQGQGHPGERRLYDQIALVISETYLEVGDGASLADDQALGLIRDLLLRHDEEIMDRNRFRVVRRAVARPQ